MQHKAGQLLTFAAPDIAKTIQYTGNPYTFGITFGGLICYDDTPNEYGIYEVKDCALSWHYKSTGKEKDHQFRVYGKGADPAWPEFHVVNVWYWDRQYYRYQIVLEKLLRKR